MTQAEKSTMSKYDGKPSTLSNSTDALTERIKELNCLYGISNLFENQDVSLAWIIQRAVELIPAAWQYPDHACARIRLDGQEYTSKNFQETRWHQNTNIVLNGEHVGDVDVYYIHPPPDEESGPFLEEEERLLRAIGERLSKVLWLKRSEEALRESEERYRVLTEQVAEGVFLVQDSRFYYVNPAFCRMFDVASAERMKGGLVHSPPDGEAKQIVALFGESGSGKELVARAIHDQSLRKNKRFVAVNCGAIQETLFEREFFGHRKGAFSSAHADSPGYLDMADGGTLFLDEVGDLTVNLQAKLLRAIEGGGYRPVGGMESISTDFRIIAASNTALSDKVTQGQMRNDFFYRIQVIQIQLPPLRDRKQDIPLLVEHFIKKMKDPAAHATIPGRIMDILMEYDWPGNVRELRNVLQRYVTLGHLEFLPRAPSTAMPPPRRAWICAKPFGPWKGPSSRRRRSRQTAIAPGRPSCSASPAGPFSANCQNNKCQKRPPRAYSPETYKKSNSR